MKKQHDGDCSIYSSLCNNRPEDGICTCGYYHENQHLIGEKQVELYSLELQKKMFMKNGGEKEYRHRCNMVKEFFGIIENPQEYIDKMLEK